MRFGKEKLGLRYTEVVMLACDVLVFVMEAPPGEGEREEEKNASWVENGIDVIVFLEEKAMLRMMDDPALWGG